MVKLLEDWKLVLKRAWSVRFALAACLMAVAEAVQAVLPFAQGYVPAGAFAALSAVAAVGGVISRVLSQRNMQPEPTDQ